MEFSDFINACAKFLNDLYHGSIGSGTCEIECIRDQVEAEIAMIQRAGRLLQAGLSAQSQIPSMYYQDKLATTTTATTATTAYSSIMAFSFTLITCLTPTDYNWFEMGERDIIICGIRPGFQMVAEKENRKQAHQLSTQLTQLTQLTRLTRLVSSHSAARSKALANTDADERLGHINRELIAGWRERIGARGNASNTIAFESLKFPPQSRLEAVHAALLGAEKSGCAKDISEIAYSDRLSLYNLLNRAGLSTRELIHCFKSAPLPRNCAIAGYGRFTCPILALPELRAPRLMQSDLIVVDYILAHSPLSVS